ncbi:MAG: ABC transporter substrate-binding protein [Rhodoferax sp.]
MRLRLLRLSGWLLLCLCSLAVQAQILIGQTAGLSGPQSAADRDRTEAARWYFDAVNARGGVHGQSIVLMSLDDQANPQRVRNNVLELVDHQNVLALFLTSGTAISESVVPVLSRAQLPLVAPATGAAALRWPPNRLVFNVRGSYQREARQAIEHLATTADRRLAVVYADDAFGRDALLGADKAFVHARVPPLLVLRADPARPNHAALAARIARADARGVLWIGAPAFVAEGVRRLREAGSIAQVATLSNNASEAFVSALGDAANGVIVTQLFPSEQARKHPFVQEVLQLARAHPGAEPRAAHLEGVAAAKVLVEGLRRCIGRPTRTSLVAALESLRDWDLGGGLRVSYGPASRGGLEYADLAIIDSTGRFRR